MKQLNVAQVKQIGFDKILDRLYDPELSGPNSSLTIFVNGVEGRIDFSYENGTTLDNVKDEDKVSCFVVGDDEDDAPICLKYLKDYEVYSDERALCSIDYEFSHWLENELFI